jgi:glycosyltransferase involved in cell wall biosynthesis
MVQTRVKVLHIIPSVDPRTGGPIEGIRRQDAATHNRGAREIMSLDDPRDPWVSESSVPVHALGAGKARKGLLGRYGYSPRAVEWLRTNLHRYDAVVVNGLWNFATYTASCILPGRDIPYFVFPHGMMDPWFRKQYPLKHHAKQLSWLMCEGRLLRSAEAVLFTTEIERADALGQFWGYGYRECMVGYGTEPAPVPSDTHHAAFRSRVPDLDDRPYILFLSRIHPKKGVELLIEAISILGALVDNYVFVIAGPADLSYLNELQAQAERLGVSHRLRWPGMLQGDAKWGAYFGCDAFILPSHQENFGIVVAEALACSRPVLITDRVNIWKEVEVAQAGFVSADDSAGIQNLLRQWVGTDDVQRRHLRKNALALFQQSFEVRHHANLVMDLIEKAVLRRTSRTDRQLNVASKPGA